ncbi:branched-chain amino acid aminotransferase II [Schizophyllum commune Tattone D]|nr:branched-chain amino acid aminotransferase II [Schizophyllum commune Tattone D]
MLVVDHDPIHGWNAPEIKPFGPLSLDPTSSCFHYCPCVFEGMKAYLGPNGKPRLFRPQLNMARLLRSAVRSTLPAFDPEAALELIKRLVAQEARWIPNKPYHGLYIRPTIIGTRPSVGVMPTDDYGLFFAVCVPAGPHFVPGTSQPLALLAVEDRVRAWPGGTGAYKMGGNYAPAFESQKDAMRRGYNQNLWLIGENQQICEAGIMNFFAVVRRDDGDVDLITPELDGTILPGITRQSILELADAHTAGRTELPGISPSTKIHTHQRLITLPELRELNTSGKLLEVFACGTAVVVVPIGRIGYKEEDIELPKYIEGYGPVAKGLWERLVAIQEGRFEWEDWSMPCVE